MELHYLTNFPVLLTNKKMDVVGHQTVGIDMTCTYRKRSNDGFPLRQGRQHPNESPIVIRLFKKILAVDASQHDMIDACPALNSSDSRHIRMNNARSHIIIGYRSSFIAGRIKNQSP
jgi:hypothetical protein